MERGKCGVMMQGARAREVEFVSMQSAFAQLRIARSHAHATVRPRERAVTARSGAVAATYRRWPECRTAQAHAQGNVEARQQHETEWANAACQTRSHRSSSIRVGRPQRTSKRQHRERAQTSNHLQRPHDAAEIDVDPPVVAVVVIIVPAPAPLLPLPLALLLPLARARSGRSRLPRLPFAAKRTDRQKMAVD